MSAKQVSDHLCLHLPLLCLSLEVKLKKPQKLSRVGKLKAILHPKILIMSSNTHPHVVQTLKTFVQNINEDILNETWEISVSTFTVQVTKTSNFIKAS